MDNTRQPTNSFTLCGVICDATDVLLYVLAFFFPPFPILARLGYRSPQFVIGLLLSIFFHIPGLLYALYIVYDTSIITGSREGLTLRFRNHGYTPINDTEAAIPPVDGSPSSNQIIESSIISPIPQHLAPKQLYRDSSTPEQQAGTSSQDDIVEEAGLPSYNEAVGPASGNRIVSGDFKVQR